MAIKEFRCIVSELNIRSEPRTGDQTKTNQTLKRGERITINDADYAEGDGFVWVKHARGWSVERSLDGRFVFLADGVQPRDAMWGINIDPNNPQANPPAVQLTSVGWVRFVFHVESRLETLDQAFRYFDPYIQNYARAGVRILLILNQDTYRGNIPWTNNGDWNAYARGMGERAALIARRYRGLVRAYQVWNEGDLSGFETSIGITPAQFAPMLAETARGITAGDPAALVVSGGLASSLDKAINYMREVRKALGGTLPIDGIGIHPYGHTPPGDSSPFPGWSVGSLDNYLNQFSTAFPGIPLWITEIGVPRVDVDNQDFWPRIASYMDKTIDFVRESYPHAVQAVMWFAWSDPMDRAGIVNASQKPKGAQYTTFFRNVFQDFPRVYNPMPTPFDGGLGLTHVAGTPIRDESVTALAERIALSAANMRHFLLKGSRGLNFLPASNGGPGVASFTDYSVWAAIFARYRIRLHAWHELVGSDLDKEPIIIKQIAQASGVRSVVLDIETATLALRTAAAVRSFMLALRKTLPAGTPLGLSFDGRPAQFPALNLAEWFPFIDWWHPRITGDPKPALQALYAAMRPFRKPILPILPAIDGAATRTAARFATDSSGSPALLFTAALEAGSLAVARSTNVPFLAGYAPRRVLGTLTVVASTTLNVRALPMLESETLGSLKPGDRIETLEQRSIPPLEWVRHAGGWSAARNTSNGEVYLK